MAWVGKGLDRVDSGMGSGWENVGHRRERFGKGGGQGLTRGRQLENHGQFRGGPKRGHFWDKGLIKVGLGDSFS